MPRKSKAESVVEKVEKKVKRAAKEILHEVKEIGEKIGEKTESIVEELSNENNKNKHKSKLAGDEKEEKIAKLKEKARKLAVGIKSEKISLKEESTEEEKYLVAPVEDYLKSSMHLGTRVITPDMKEYIYKRRADGLAVFNTAILDKKLLEGAEYLAQFAPEDVLVICKREAGEKALELFSQVTGIKSFIKKYPAGILTNPLLEEFMETDLVLVCDTWIDKGALADAIKIKIPVMAICDTNNYTIHVNKIIPGNNKSAKSLGFIFYHLARLYVEKRKLSVQIPPISKWVENWDNLVPPK